MTDLEKVRAGSRQRSKAYRQRHPEKINAYCKQYRKDHPQWSNEQSFKWRRKNPEKRAAHAAVTYALKTGRIKKGKACEGCGVTETPQLDGHHADYSQKLVVVWLCPKCHKDIHK